MENQPRKLRRPRFTRVLPPSAVVVDASRFDTDPFEGLASLFPNAPKLAPVVFTADDPDPFQDPTPAPPSSAFLPA
jgi:hypothetical protein